MEENKMEKMEVAVEESTTEREDFGNNKWNDLPVEESKNGLNFGAVALVTAVVGGIAYGVWHKKSKKKKAEAEEDEFKEDLNEVEKKNEPSVVVAVEAAEPEPVKEEPKEEEPKKEAE